MNPEEIERLAASRAEARQEYLMARFNVAVTLAAAAFEGLEKSGDFELDPEVTAQFYIDMADELLVANGRTSAGLFDIPDGMDEIDEAVEAAETPEED